MDIRAQAFSPPDLLPFARVQDQALQISGNESRSESTRDIRQSSLQRNLAAGLDGLSTRLQKVGSELKNIEHLCLPVACSPFDYPADTQGVADYLKARQLQGATLQGALHGLDSALEMRLPQEHLLDAQLNMYANYSATAGSAEQKLFAADTLAQLPTMESAAGNIQYAPRKKAGGDFFKELNGMIGFIRTDYLAVYENSLTKYSNLYKTFNEKVMSKMGQWVTGQDDGKKVKIDVGLLSAIDNLIVNRPNQVLYPVAGGQVTQSEAKKWATALGLNPDKAVVSMSGYFAVMMNISPLLAMREVLNAGFIEAQGEGRTDLKYLT